MILNKKAIDEIKRRLKAKAELIGEIIKSDAMALTPVDLGNLKASNQSTCVETANGFEIYNFNTANYALYVEMGTGIYSDQPGARKDGWVYPSGDPSNPEFFWTEGQKPQPFLFPALVNNKNRIKRILKK